MFKVEGIPVYDGDDITFTLSSNFSAIIDVSGLIPHFQSKTVQFIGE